MKRFFVNHELGKDFELAGSEHHHLANVARTKVGEQVIVCNGDEFDYIYTATRISKNISFLVFERKELNAANPEKNLTVFMAVIKFDNLAMTVEKLNEIGVSELMLFTSERVNAKPPNIGKLKIITEQSCKQCGRSIPMNIRGVLSFKEMMLELKKCGKEGLAIGPEGGFTPTESEQIFSIKSATPAWIGGRTLRSETAAIAFAARILL